MSRNAFRAAALFAIYVSFASPAFAYLDPATGSIAVQAIIGAVATWVMYSKMFAARAKSFFTRRAKGSSAEESE